MSIWKFINQSSDDSVEEGYCISVLLLAWINFYPTGVSNHIQYKVWSEITYPFPNFSGVWI